MKILLVDDEPDVRRSLINFLQKLGHHVTGAVDGQEGLKIFHSDEYDVVITDIRMPGMDGIELLRRIKSVERSAVSVIVITGHGDMENAVKALKYGAYDYLQKPINVRELAITLERAEEYATLRKNYAQLKEEFRQRLERETHVFRGEAERLREAYLNELGLGEIGIYSDAMRHVISLAEKYSLDRSISVLIHGETGTGKELVARYVHYYGDGNKLSPFVAINCGAITEELFEAELFGHEPGAYTGATRTGRMGKMEAAHGGTLFLDEIGEMPPSIQVKLLRVLEEKRFYRVGGLKEIPVDIRIVSATNRDLKKDVAEGRFRRDLFYRINMGVIRIPPLRERREDILPLALRFVRRASSRRGKRFGSFTKSGEQYLLSYSWPGNVRQLKNAMERLALLGPWDRVDDHALSFVEEMDGTPDLLESPKPVLGRDDFDLPGDHLDLEELNRTIIRKALNKHRGNQTRTAQYLRISRRVLQTRLKRMRTQGF